MSFTLHALWLGIPSLWLLWLFYDKIVRAR